MPQKPPRFIGIQCKAGEGLPGSNANLFPEWIESVYLFQGNAPQHAHLNGKLIDLSRSEIVEFLGYSLRPLYPSSDEATS